MTSILDLPDVRRRFSRLSVNEYHRLDEFNQNGKRTELIRGIILEKPRKTPSHSTIVARLRHVVERRLVDGYSLRQHAPLTLRDSEPEPDIAVVRGLDTDFDEAHPTTAALVVEIASEVLELNSELASIYAEAGVEECWFIHDTERAVEVYRRPVNGIYQEKSIAVAGSDLVCGSVPGLTISLDEIFI